MERSNILLGFILSVICCFDIYGQNSSSALFNEEKWACNITFDNQLGPFSTFLFFNSEGSEDFIAHSTKNADRRIFGNVKATVARLLKKSPKKGIFLKITDGLVVSKYPTDSLYGLIHIPMIGKMSFKALKTNDRIVGIISDSNEIIGKLTGIKSKGNITPDFSELTKKLFDTTRFYFYQPELLETKQWKRFSKKIYKLSMHAVDDIEYFLGFNIFSQKLPFSHFNLFLFSRKPDLSVEVEEEYLLMEELSNKTAYLIIKSFGGSSKEMDSIFHIILMNNYENLIIDLRDNTGGGLNSAITFGKYLSPKEIDAGFFITNKWYTENHNNDPFDFSSIPVTNATTTSGFIDELKHSVGKHLVISPGNRTFKGSVYILTSEKTGSTCEPIVYALKKNKLATLVGEKTSGAMLSASFFNILDKYYIFLPIADYYTADKKRLDKVGVEPNITVESKEALSYVLDHLLF